MLAAMLMTAFISGCAYGGHERAAAVGPPKASCEMLTSIDPGLRAEIDPIVDAATAEGFAGQVAIARNGVFVYRRNTGSADLTGAIPVTDRTLYQLSSITKYFTAVLTLKAVEEGRLHLDDRISPLLGGVTVGRPEISVVDLLEHRSGLGSSYAAEATTDGAAAVTAIAAQPFDASRVGAFHYSNDGYDLLAVIIERLYGQRYEDIARAKLIGPACLAHLGFWGEIDRNDPHERAQALQVQPPSLQRRTYGMIGSAGLLSTAVDLVSFEHALNAGRVLSPAMLAELRTSRLSTSVGPAMFGSFLVTTPGLGRTISARGTEDWGDNGYLNDYIDCGFTLALVTSRGPAENSGKPMFRDSVTPQIERVLASRCSAR
jgi:CubicO group peptidase (beta-lactamase class C family)